MKGIVLAAGILCGLTVGSAIAQQASILVTQDIAVSTIWTANNVYNLQNQIYVLPGATLTIEAGTVIASTTNAGGSLAVSRGARIFVQGTAQEPVIFTSEADVATWAGLPSHPTRKDPRTGTWREAANEWGNITVMGRGYISEDVTLGNSPTPSASNVAAMEGLVGATANDPKVIYGGGDDDDDSGTIEYLSLRYGGKVIGLNNELNGLSLGGIGRATDIHHVEIMNNVDDGIEIWGGTVNLKYVSIWNIGDDSLDVDQGWRGKAQFGLIVQGFSLNASQGSGVGDNCFELDGAEDSDWQPVTTATIYNFTAIGQPLDGDHATAWRDNARVQFRNCTFMDIGEEVVRFDNVDGDGAHGYGWMGTLSWPATWTTPSTATSAINAPANPAAFYTVQTSGNLAEIKDSVFFNNGHANAYNQAESIGGMGFNIFMAPGNGNVKEPAASPIQSIIRGPTVVKGGKLMQPVIGLDPRPAGVALTSTASANPSQGFWSLANYRGGFAPGENWLCGWTASTAFGMSVAGGNPTIDIRQVTIGTVNVLNSCLQTGADTFNVVTVDDPCPGGPGTGTLLGLCASTPGTLFGLVNQISTPSAPGNIFHFPATSPTVNWGNLPLPGGLTLEAACLQVDPATGTLVVGKVDKLITQ